MRLLCNITCDKFMIYNACLYKCFHVGLQNKTITIHSDSTRSKRRSEAVTSQAVDRTSESSNEDTARVESERRRPSKEELLLRTDLLYYVPTFPQWVARPDTDNDGFVPTTSPAGGEEVAGGFRLILKVMFLSSRAKYHKEKENLDSKQISNSMC